MEMALSTYAVDFLRERVHLGSAAVMMNRTAYEGVTDLGDFETVMYGIEPDGYYMTATSEHPLTAMYMGETVPEEHLPLRLVGVSDCFRRGRRARPVRPRHPGVHQFRKVEQIVIDVLRARGTCMRNCCRTASTCGTPSASTTKWSTSVPGTWAPWPAASTTEAWLPGARRTRSVLLNCTDYQANRLQMPHRRARPRQPAHRAHPEFHGRGHQPRAGRHHGAEPARRRARAGARRAAALHGRSGRARILRLLSGFTREVRSDPPRSTSGPCLLQAERAEQEAEEQHREGHAGPTCYEHASPNVAAGERVEREDVDAASTTMSGSSNNSTTTAGVGIWVPRVISRSGKTEQRQHEVGHRGRR